MKLSTDLICDCHLFVWDVSGDFFFQSTNFGLLVD